MIVIDTCLIYAIYDEDDENHATAKAIFTRIFSGVYAQPVLLDHVYDELLTLVYIRSKRFDLCVEIAQKLNEFISDNIITFLHTPSEIFWKANQIFLEQKIEDQKRFLSFTDSVIGVMAEWLKATYIGTFDTQFHRFQLRIVSK